MPVPAHSHDHYEETIYGIDGVLTGPSTDNKSTSRRGRCYAFRAAPFTVSITTDSTM